MAKKRYSNRNQNLIQKIWSEYKSIILIIGGISFITTLAVGYAIRLRNQAVNTEHGVICELDSAYFDEEGQEEFWQLANQYSLAEDICTGLQQTQTDYLQPSNVGPVKLVWASQNSELAARNATTGNPANYEVFEHVIIFLDSEVNNDWDWTSIAPHESGHAFGHRSDEWGELGQGRTFPINGELWGIHFAHGFSVTFERVAYIDCEEALRTRGVNCADSGITDELLLSVGEYRKLSLFEEEFMTTLYGGDYNTEKFNRFLETSGYTIDELQEMHGNGGLEVACETIWAIEDCNQIEMVEFAHQYEFEFDIWLSKVVKK